MYLIIQILKWLAIFLITLGVSFLLLSRPVSDIKTLSSDIKQKPALQKKEINLLSGIDVSHYQGKVDWDKVLDDNIHFVYLKATDGITYTDPRFHENQNALIKNRVVYGAYHFFEPKDSGIKQAENFLLHVKMNEEMLPPVLDIEITQGVNKELLKQHAKEWLDTVSLKLGCQPIIYSYSSFYMENLGDDFLEYPVWIADYTKKPNLLLGGKHILWQHTQKGDVMGIDTMVDKNWFFGNENKLKLNKCKKGDVKKDE